MNISQPSGSVTVVGIGGPAGSQGPAGQSTVSRVAATAMSARQVVRTNASAQTMAKAITDLRTLPFDGLCLGDVQSGASGNYHVAGPVPANVLQLGAGVACAVGVDATGMPVRAVDPTCVSAPNWLGTCDASGNVTVNPRRSPRLFILDFGADPTGASSCDAAAAAALLVIAALGGGTIEFPPGAFKFADTFGPLPENTHITGSHEGVTQLRFFGAGVGIQIGDNPNANVGKNVLIEKVDVQGYLDTGEADYPDINEVGLEVLGANATIRDCSFGGFKYQLSLDGAEVCWCERLHFDLEGHGYTDMLTDLDATGESAFAIRMGSFKFNFPQSANGLWVYGCQFANSRFGVLHNDGVGQYVSACNFEGCAAWAIITSATTVGWRDCIGESATIANFWIHSFVAPSTSTGLVVDHCFMDPSVPGILLDGTAALYGLSFINNDCSNFAGTYPIQNNGALVAPVTFEGSRPPGSGPSSGGFLDTLFSGLSGIPGSAVNMGFAAQAALDVQLFEYPAPLLLVRDGSKRFLEFGGPQTGTDGTWQDFRRLTSANTGTDNNINAETGSRFQVIQGASAANYVPLGIPDESSGIVIMTVSSAKVGDAGRNAIWEIWQSFHRSGTTLMLDGVPVTSKFVDNDGSFVSPTIAVASGSVVARVTGHPSFVSAWNVSFRVQTVGQ